MRDVKTREPNGGKWRDSKGSIAELNWSAGPATPEMNTSGIIDPMHEVRCCLPPDDIFMLVAVRDEDLVDLPMILLEMQNCMIERHGLR